jgi:hypothetical protein
LSNAIVQALEDAAKKIEQAVIDAAKSVGHFFEDTGTRLRQAVDDLTTHDGKAAADLEKAGKHADETPSVHGAGGATTPASAAGGGAGGNLAGDLENATHLPNATDKLSSADYPYLQHESGALESEAVPGALPRTTSRVVGDTSAHPPLPDRALSTFQGDVTPSYLEPGQTYYRWVGDGSYPNGSFWSPTPPRGGTGELRSDLAVKNEWNGDHGIVVFTPSQRVPVYSGPAAPQWGTGSTDHYLPGGGTQIWTEPGKLGPDDGDWSIAPVPEGSGS